MTITNSDKISLYQLSVGGLEIEEMLRNNGGELTPEFECWLDDFLAKGKDKLEGAAMVVQSLQASGDACLSEASRLVLRGNTFHAQADGLKARMLGAVDSAFGGKVKTDYFTIWGQTSGAATGYEVAPDADLASIQKAYPEVVRTKYELDKLTLKSMRAQGQPIPEAISVTENPGTRFLRIK